MAYGRIKADTLVFDNSGNDVELAISAITTGSLSSYAPLAGAAFTGGITGTTAGFTGNVGIGTTSPGENLHVFSNGCAIKIDSTGDSALRFAVSGTNKFSIFQSSDTLRFFDNTNNSERMRIDSSGNVGIGTSSPAGKAYIAGPNASTFGVTADAALNLAAANGAVVDRVVNLNFACVDSATNAVAAVGMKYTSQSGFGKGDLIFGTRSVTTDTAPTERMRIDSDGVAHFNGDVKVLNGDIQMGSGRGISFSANSHATGMTSESLDDYEEGTWTPAIQGLSNTPSYHNLAGKYTKIGRVVYLQGFIQMNALATFTNNNAIYQIGGVPFAVANGSGYYRAQGSFNAQQFGINGAYNDYGVTGQASVGFETTTTIGFQVTSNYGTRGRIRNSAAAGSLILEFSITYAVS